MEKSWYEFRAAVQVDAAEFWSANAAVTVDVQQRGTIPVGKLRRFSHRVAADLGADAAIGNVILVRDRPVAARQQEQAVCTGLRHTGRQEADTLEGEGVGTMHVAVHVIQERAGYLDAHFHWNARR